MPTKLVELTDVADYIGKRYGPAGWRWPRVRQEGQEQFWIGLPFGASGGPLVLSQVCPQIRSASIGCRKTMPAPRSLQELQAAGKPAGFAPQRRRRRQRLCKLVAVVAQRRLLDEEATSIINSKETIAALKIPQGTLIRPSSAGTPSWNRRQAQTRLLVRRNPRCRQRRLAVFSLKKRSGDGSIAEDTEHQLLIKGLAEGLAMSGLTLNAMVFKHSPYPNAAKAFLQFMLEKEQYEPWLNANSGYWRSRGGLRRCRGVVGRSQGCDLQDTMKSNYYNGYNGPISTATGAVNATTCWCRCARPSPPMPRRRKPRQQRPERRASGISAGRRRIRKIETVIACDKRRRLPQGSEATKQSILFSSGEMDCFASLRNDERKISKCP